jgi:hypothetical protein
MKRGIPECERLEVLPHSGEKGFLTNILDNLSQELSAFAIGYPIYQVLSDIISLAGRVYAMCGGH